MQNAEYTWDFFIAHAGSDQSVAESLYERLAVGSRVFLDSKCLKPGDNWDTELPLAQRQALVTVVLISSNTAGAYYQREEIAAAISLSRTTENKYRVVPIFLDGDSQKYEGIPYGLTLKHGIAISKGNDLQAAAERLLDLIDSLRGSPEWLKYAPKPPSLPEGKKWHAYLSYRDRHRVWVIKLYEGLQKAGFKCWFDSTQLTAGKNFRQTLQDALTSSRGAVLVWSSASEESEWVRHEAEAFLRCAYDDSQFHLVVVSLRADLLPFFLQGLIRVSQDPEGPTGLGLLQIASGLTGTPLTLEAVKFIARTTNETNAELYRIAGSRMIGDQSRLKEIGKGNSLAWVTSSSIAGNAAEALLELGAYPAALEVLATASEYFQDSVRLGQLKALTLSRIGRLLDAHRLIADLCSAGHEEPDTLLILADIWMRKYVQTKERLHLEKSRSLCLQALALAPSDAYVGLNAAAKSALLGEKEAACQYARETESFLNTQSTSRRNTKVLIRAEIKLICQEYDEAAKLYKEATVVDPEAIGLREEFLSEARMLMQALDVPAQERLRIEQILEKPSDCSVSSVIVSDPLTH